MAQPFKVIVTDKTDFKEHDALSLGEILTFVPDKREYTKPNGHVGDYDNWWLKHMLHIGAFELLQDDDPLPAVPDSVMYFNHNNTRKFTATKEMCTVALTTGDSIRAVRLTPDAVLQLAHDLRRMAMEIKRERRDLDEV